MMSTKPNRQVSVFFVLLLPAVLCADVVKWDYDKQPVKVIQSTFTSVPWLEWSGKTAFDGFGTQGDKPAAIRAWRLTDLPTTSKPAVVEIDYGQPVAVSCFVHYFYVPGSRDLRYTAPIPSAYKTVRISSKNDDEEWSEVITLEDLPVSCPQKLIMNSTKSSRYWRIEVLELVDGAEMLHSYEIETWTGGVPEIAPWNDPFPDFPAEFNRRMLSHKPLVKNICSPKAFEGSNKYANLVFKTGQQDFAGKFELQVDGVACEFKKLKKEKWKAVTASGTISLGVKKTNMGFLLHLSFSPNAVYPSRYKRASVRLNCDDINLYYIPAYIWDLNKPADMMVNSCNVQTRLAGLGTKDGMLMLVPGTDRGTLGFMDGQAGNDLLLSEEPTPILIAYVQGDWWSAFQYAVTDIYNFKEPLQTVSVSDIQYGISRYILRDDVWDPTLGTMRSWPETDFLGEGFVTFSFYGSTYSIPAYYARYVMSGDPLALERCRSIANWLCKSGIRVQEGPAKGAFFNMQVFGSNKAEIEKQGCTQAQTSVLTSQSTGAVLWTLLYYRKVTGENNLQIDQVIQEAVTWLLQTQRSDGGWAYGHQLDGSEVSDAAPSSGTIWNIWALWRLGKETGDSRYREAAEKGKNWFKKTFVIPHHYHGYWEDVGPGSREGYEAAVAVVAFGEMGEKELVVQTAKDAMQWVFTRRIECREANCSAGLVAEQTGWPPAAYCNPMMGLAAWTAWQTTKDDFWKPFARIPKAIGWWYQPENGAMVWIIDSLEMAPIAGPSFESWWCDWINAQIGSLTLRWLVREVNLHSAGDISIDEEILCGKAIHREVKLWAPPGGLHPIIPPDGQVNWLGFRGEDSILIAFMNYGNSGEIHSPLDSRDVQGASLCPKKIYIYKNKKIDSRDWDGSFPLHIEANEMIVLEWRIKP